MNIAEIKNFIESNKGVAIPELQSKFGINYKEAKELVDGLLDEGELVYESGVRYNYIGRNGEDGAREEDGQDKRYAEYREYLEARRRELISRMRRREDEDDEEDDGDDCAEMDDNELRYKALKACVERGAASASMIQRLFPVGYIRACGVIDWMEEQGYVSAGTGTLPRKVLMTVEEFRKKFNGSD